MRSLSELMNIHTRLQGRVDGLTDEVKSISIQQEALKLRHKHELDAQALIQKAGQRIQQRLAQHLKDITQSFLDAVFPGAYQFVVRFVPARGKTDIILALTKNGTEMNPMKSNGGGVVDVVSTALRIACWSISKTRNTLLMDEPFKFLSARHRPQMGEIIRSLSDRLKLQMIIITHDPAIASVAHRTVTIDQQYRVSFVKSVTEGTYDGT